ncbi:unnamed protein product [Ambrosiozyma monospora]|uniref:Unnamed protein product n=1 Tax=Ambrosiozyma monospora TaxID=43982 RepID=A0ACB5UA68_AMBMO|nr:unnamed protein product [Ambrosiozyma monospora]
MAKSDKHGLLKKRSLDDLKLKKKSASPVVEPGTLRRVKSQGSGSSSGSGSKLSSKKTHAGIVPVVGSTTVKSKSIPSAFASVKSKHAPSTAGKPKSAPSTTIKSTIKKETPTTATTTTAAAAAATSSTTVTPLAKVTDSSLNVVKRPRGRPPKSQQHKNTIAMIASGIGKENKTPATASKSTTTNKETTPVPATTRIQNKKRVQRNPTTLQP